MLKLEDNIVNDSLNITEYKVKFNDLEASIYYEKEITKEDLLIQEKQIEALKASIEKREKLLSNVGFTSKAPEKLVNEEREKLESEKKLLSSLI